MDELFQRIGARNIWDRIGSKSRIMVFFDSPQASEARSKCEKYLNNFVDLRNKIAHPASDFEWPDISQIIKYIDYFEKLGESISEEMDVYELQYPIRNNH